MPDLDVTEILSDPDLADLFDVIRRTEVVGATGRSTLTEVTTVGVAGVVTPGDPGNLLRKDDSQMTSRVISISTTYRLRASGEGFQPDILLYDGVRYTVKATQLWTRFGAGFVNAVATSMNAADPAPV